MQRVAPNTYTFSNKLQDTTFIQPVLSFAGAWSGQRNCISNIEIINNAGELEIINNAGDFELIG